MSNNSIKFINKHRLSVLAFRLKCFKREGMVGWLWLFFNFVS